MTPKPEPLSEWTNVPRSKGRPAWWPPRTIGQWMLIVALSGLAMATYTHRPRTVPAPVRLWRLPAVPVQVQGQFRVPTDPSRPVDPFTVIALPGIDDGMIVAAPSGIDDAMIVNRGLTDGPLLRRAPALPVPRQGWIEPLHPLRVTPGKP